MPIAVATTISLQGLRGALSGAQVMLFIAIWIATRIWKAAVRQYSGASS